MQTLKRKASTMTQQLIKLEQARRGISAHDERYRQTDYEEASPFFENPRGVLIHRVRSLYRLEVSWSSEWWIVEYWCENSGRTDAVDSGLVFDPGSKLICTRCEANAIAKGKKTSSELAGRHVCTGVVRAMNTCCTNESN
jgi:hypothetical protein